MSEEVTNINESEQWLLNGDCSKCRRKNYCGAKCTKGKHNLGSGVFIYDGINTPRKLTDEEVKMWEEGLNK